MEFESNEVLSGPTWPELLTTVENAKTHGQWIFRALRPRSVGPESPTGSRIAAILSSFDDACDRRIRSTIRAGDRRLYEAWMLREFKREAYHHLVHLPNRDDYLEWLALGRHYGMPARLVDFTYSFYVSLYFAISELGRDEDGWIVAFNLSWNKDQVELKLKTAWKPWSVPDVRAAFQDAELFKQFAFVQAAEYVVSVNPLRRNPRLAAQQGLFLCPGNIGRSFDENIQSTVGSEPNVKRLIRLPPKIRKDAWDALRTVNISLASLFRDLSGWAESQRDVVHRDIPDDRFRKELELELTDPRG